MSSYPPRVLPNLSQANLSYHLWTLYAPPLRHDQGPGRESLLGNCGATLSPIALREYNFSHKWDGHLQLRERLLADGVSGVYCCYTPRRGRPAPSPTIMSIEARPLQTDAAALSDSYGRCSSLAPFRRSLASRVPSSYLVSANPPTTVTRRARLGLARGPMPVWSARPLGRENVAHMQGTVYLERPPLPRSRPFFPYKKWVLRTLVYCKKIS